MKRFPKAIRNYGRPDSVLDESRILVAFKKAIPFEGVEAVIKELNLKLEKDEGQRTNKHWIQINHTDQRYWLRSQDGSAIDDNEFTRIQKVLGSKVDWIGPVYQQTTERRRVDYFCPIPTVLLYRKSKKDDLEEVTRAFGLKVNELKSRYSTSFYYLEVVDVKKTNAYEIRERMERPLKDVLFESMPMYKPLAATIPNDTLWANQWDMTQINAPNGWDISTGSNAVVICILDEGCDLTHPDLQFSEDGINLGTMMPTGAPTGSHGTACAGIAAASFNNGAGVAGVAGGCLIMPVAFVNWTDAEIANGINYAATNGADVLSMSFGGYGIDPLIVDPEIQNAFNNNVVMCAATHNFDAAITSPATHPLVIACGASSTDDNRKTAMSPDGECWGSNFGDLLYNGVQTGVSVVAPGVLCPTTDRQGNDGYYDGTGPINNWACVNYPNPGSTDGNYILMFDGTSAATPHVSGLAALLRSNYPALSNVQIRSIIERSAAKVGTLAYAETAGFPNGTRNQEMGYGRIDVFHALDFADTMIKDWPGDNGIEPSSPAGGNFWDFSDIVTRITDDNVFNPSNPTQSKNVERGQTNYLYVQVTNNGPRDSRNVTVNVRITPYVGLQFVYPNDWTAVDAMHVSPTSVTNNFATVPAGTTVIAKFSISSAQVEDLYGWQTDHPWHPCLLAQVTSDNDYAYASADLSFGNLVTRKNDFAQRNLTVIDVLASPGASPSVAFPFVVGSRFSKAKFVRLNVDRSKLPRKAKVTLNLGDNRSIFPMVDFTPSDDAIDGDHATLLFQNSAKVVTKLGCCDVRITFEKNSKIEMLCNDKSGLNIRSVKGGDLTITDGEQAVRLTADKSTIDFEVQERTLHALAVHIEFPKDIKRGDEYSLVVSQSNETNDTLGGATSIYKVV
jgi:subtilisin family serine protease